MVRQGYLTNPSEKKLELFKNFSGGLNTVTTNDNLQDHELVFLENADLDARGNVTRRLGMTSRLVPPVSGVGQGYFRYYLANPTTTKNFIKPFTDSSWSLQNGAVASAKTDASITFSSSYSTGVNLLYTMDSTLIPRLKGNQVTLEFGTYMKSQNDGVIQVFVKTVSNTNWSVILSYPASSGSSNLIQSTTLASDLTDFKIEVQRDTTSANGLPITVSNVQLEVGAVATPFTPFQSINYEEITAVNGALYKNGIQLPITNLANFQTTRRIEAVQFQTSLYIATGSGLVEYDGTTAKTVTPYKPNGLDAMYVGYNALYPDPINYVSDSTSIAINIDTIIYDKRYGVVNQPTNFTMITTKGASDILEYKTEYKRVVDSAWTTLQDYSLAAVGKTVTFKPTEATDYSFRFSVRKQGTTGQDVVFNYPKYTVNGTDQNTALSSSGIQTCNRIFVLNDRLCMYGDTVNSNQLYISHLNNPRYFPTNNMIDFKSNRQEGITACVIYRNNLVVFTPTSTQMLVGSSPQDYTKMVINASVGCIAPYSACLVTNGVYFVSKEGIFILYSIRTIGIHMDVKRVDMAIWNSVPKSTDCVGVYYNKQFHLIYPTDNVRFRYYTDLGVWTRDTSSKMTLCQLTEWDGLLIGQRKDVGDIVQFDPKNLSIVTDLGEVYKFIVETKYFDFGQPYHKKVLKQMQLLMKVQGSTSNLKVYVSADSSIVVNPDTTAIQIQNGSVQWINSSIPNVHVDSGTVLGSWTMGTSAFGTLDSVVSMVRLSGKCRRTKIKIVQEENLPCNFLGVAYIFKLRKPK
jgi:hypothetical protein